MLLPTVSEDGKVAQVEASGVHTKSILQDVRWFLGMMIRALQERIGVMAPKRALSAYFVFANEQREAARNEYLASSGAEKVSVAAVAKLLGEKWRVLSDEERAQYQKLAAEKAAAAEEAANAQAMDVDQPGEMHETGEQDKEMEQQQPPAGLPLSLVKRIMLLDKDVNSISSDALKATAKAAELVIEMLVARAYKGSTAAKRRTINFGDVDQAVHADDRWEISGIRELFSSDDLFAEARSDRKEGHGGRPKHVEEADPKARSITEFFKV